MPPFRARPVPEQRVPLYFPMPRWLFPEPPAPRVRLRLEDWLAPGGGYVNTWVFADHRDGPCGRHARKRR